jgi:hypothetical protein
MNRKNNTLQNWEKALSIFLKDWLGKPYVIGVLVSGSRVFGTDTKYSDIDVHIILDDKVKWRERGTRIVNGYLIEYFANPVKQLMRYRTYDRADFTLLDSRMFAKGKILFDKTGVVKKLQDSAKKELKTRFRKLSKVEVDFGKYFLWDDLDNLKDLSQRKNEFYSLSYSLLLNRTLETYRKFLGVEVCTTSKLDRYFKEPDFRAKYSLKEFPDSRFVNLFLMALNKQNNRNISNLVDYVIKVMGGLNLKDWKVRTAIEL